MSSAMTFNTLLENVEKLPLEDQETLLDIIHRRIAEHRRRALAKTISAAREEYKSEKLKPETPEEIMQAIMS